MALPIVSFPPFLVALCLGIGWLPHTVAHGVPQERAAALIQTRGTPLRAGGIRGGSQVALERAEGGDTPVLSFRSPRGAVVRLLLDTGAAASLVTPALVQRLGLPRRSLPPEAFSMAGGGTACPTLRLSSTEMPPLVLGGETPWPGLRLGACCLKAKRPQATIFDLRRQRCARHLLLIVEPFRLMGSAIPPTHRVGGLLLIP